MCLEPTRSAHRWWCWEWESHRRLVRFHGRRRPCSCPCLCPCLRPCGTAAVLPIPCSRTRAVRQEPAFAMSWLLRTRDGDGLILRGLIRIWLQGLTRIWLQVLTRIWLQVWPGFDCRVWPGFDNRFDQDLTAGFNQDLTAGFDQDLTAGFDQDLTTGLTRI